MDKVMKAEIENKTKDIKAYRHEWYLSHKGKTKIIKSILPWVITLFRARARCNNKNDRYGKRGIKCFLTPEEIKIIWFRDKAHLLKRPSIDRIDNNGNYTFDNCRFIELSENSRLGNLGRKQTVSQVKKRMKALSNYLALPESRIERSRNASKRKRNRGTFISSKEVNNES
jgi:hypothetical protein